MKRGQPDLMLTPREVGTQIRRHRESVMDLLHAGAFPNHIGNGHVGNGARYLIPQSDVTTYLQSLRVAA